MRELNQGSTLFLLYGENEVGKTRLLQELSQSRLSERGVFWLELDSGGDIDETHMDRSAEVEALFAAAGNGDIIIADHFEMALKKTRHQLFLSWSTDGIDKQLNLIIASNTEGFNELRQLSQQYQVEVQSFQQLPFNADEVQAFLGFYLFPDQPTGKLSIPSPLRKQIASTQGIVGKVIEIVDREGSQIESTSTAKTEPTPRQSSKNIYLFAILLVLVLGVGWYLLNHVESNRSPTLATAEPTDDVVTQTIPEAEPLIEPEPQVEVKSTPAVEVVSEPAVVSEVEDAGDTTADLKPVMETLATTESQVATELDEAVDNNAELEVVAASEPELAAEPEPETSGTTQAQQPLEAEPGTASDSDAVIDESIVDSQPPAVEPVVVEANRIPASSKERFELELQQSLKWIGQRDDKVGTVQILLLSYENFDADNYYEYIANLALRQVDTDKLRVFKTYTGNREVYSVVYGEFASRQVALGELGNLPAVLRDASPLARSVGGLWQEIRRLESGN